MLLDVLGSRSIFFISERYRVWSNSVEQSKINEMDAVYVNASIQRLTLSN